MGGRVASPTFVGRVEELQTLEAARRRAATSEPAVVLVGGEAGVGKTRLVAELTSRCAADGTRVLAGGCLPVGAEGLPYAPIVAALRPLLDDLGADAIRELTGPSWPELARLLPGLGEPARGQPGDAAQLRLFELLLGLLGRLAQQTPLVLVVEDLHWADRSTRALLAFLARNLRRERVLLMVTYRSDETKPVRLGSYLAELDRAGPTQRLELSPLGRAETAAQLTGILGATPAADLVDSLFARSEGNPFFTEELLQAVRSGSSALPTTLRDLLHGRVEALSEPAQQVLRVAVVAGRQVPHPLLAAVASLDDQQLVEALREALAHQLLVTRPGEDGYQFRHALLREVIDADLLPGERARLHAAYAHALAQRPKLSAGSPAAATAELATHWDAAGESARALPALIVAGLAAERAHAFPEADRHYQRALQLWHQVADPGRPAGLDRVDLLTRAAEAAALTGTTEHAIGLLEEALGQVDRAVEPVRAALLLARLGRRREIGGDEPGALAPFEEAERLLAGAPPSAARARVLAGHAQMLSLALRSPEAVPYCEEAIRVARAVGARAEEAHALSTLGLCMDDFGELDRALALHLQARRIAEEVGDAEAIMRTYVNVGHVLMLAGRERDALNDAREGYQRARQLGLERADGSYVAVNLASRLLFTGDWEECERLTAQLLAVDCWSASHLHATRGLLLIWRGEFAAAEEEFDMAQRLGPPAYAWSPWLGRAELALWKGRENEARKAVAEGLRWCADHNPDACPPIVPSICYSLALRLAADRAERAAARQAHQEVAETRRQAAPIVAELDRLATLQVPQVRIPAVACNLVLARAEQSRLNGASDPDRWQAAAAAWERLEHPFQAAYARFRQAEALLARRAARLQAEQILRTAYQTAVQLGAEPLRREIELLAQRGRLQLAEPANATPNPRHHAPRPNPSA
jgi:tetratricopeptide (TPR) repeat protein